MGKQLKIVTFSVSIQGLIFLCNTLINRGEIMENINIKEFFLKYLNEYNQTWIDKDLEKLKQYYDVDNNDLYIMIIIKTMTHIHLINTQHWFPIFY